MSNFSSRLILRSVAGAFIAAATFGAASVAFAEQPAASKTRAQVLAELREAQRTGNMMDTRTGKMLNELHPNLYPAMAATQGLTRDQVLAELREAQRNGEMVDTKTSKKMNELYPNLYPAKAATSGLSRDEVLAEFIEAKRDGEIVWTYGGTTKKLNEFFPEDYPKGS